MPYNNEINVHCQRPFFNHSKPISSEMINIDKAFNTENRTIYEYFQSPGIGYYIPLYQREYSWDSENILQLLEDIAKGVENLIEDEKNEIRFLGTIITVTETNKAKIQPQDTKALPSSIENVIDGQQRLSTMALFACLLHKHVDELEKDIIKKITKSDLEKSVKSDFHVEIEQVCKYWRNQLMDIYSVDLGRGKPERKPKIIRGNEDKWVMAEDSNTSYNSPVAKFLYEYLEFFFNDGNSPNFRVKNRAGNNLKSIDLWIRNDVMKAHVKHDVFPTAKRIIDKINQEYIWQYNREDILKHLDFDSAEDSVSLTHSVCSLIQLFSVCYYLLNRCCFTIIKPINEDWAFDMFQSLNATGTPLTAIETFKPIVVNTVTDFKTSEEHTYFQKVEDAFSDMNTAAQKSRHTKELLTSFAIVTNGEKLASHFSSQRKWLQKAFNDADNRKRSFIRLFGNYSEFYKHGWLDYTASSNRSFDVISSSTDAELVSLLLLFLKDSNHKMAITVLGRCYHDIKNGKVNSVQNFTSAVKMLSAFYILWRSTKSNSGLDDIYRNYFKGSERNDKEARNWLKVSDFDATHFRAYLKGVITDMKLDDESEWIKKASNYLSYQTSSSICKLLLMISAHNTIPDPKEKGLVKPGTKECNPFLRLEKWTSGDLKSIEHVAPEANTTGWDQSLYDDRQLFQSIGNLTLLPLKINTSASNKGFREKLLYYKHLSEKDKDKQLELLNKAEAEGIELKDSTVELLKEATFNSHIEPLKDLDYDFSWDDSFVSARTKRTLELSWNFFNQWILG